MGDVTIDQVVALVDAPAPDYRDLYYRWETEQWEAGAIDLSADRAQWQTFPEDLKRSFLWASSSFCAGDEAVTQSLVPFIDAAPTEEQQVFLSTQLVDGARHTVFFDRFFSEALGGRGGDMRSRSEGRTEHMNDGSRTLLFEMLPAAAEKIRTEKTVEALVEGILLYQIVIEGTLALTAQRYLLNFLRDGDLLPGFRRGVTAIARDGARHVSFGVRFLADTVGEDGGVAVAITTKLDGLRSLAMSAFDPPAGEPRYLDPLPYGPDELRGYALGSLDKRLSAIGVELAT